MAFVCNCNLNWILHNIASGPGWVLQTTLACLILVSSGFHATLNERPSHHSRSESGSGVEIPTAALLLTETAGNPKACHFLSACVL